MAFRFDTRDTQFNAAFAHLLAMKREISEEVDQAAAGIIAEVQAKGDAAVIAFTQRFDRLALTPATLRVSREEIAAAVAACPPDALAALRFAHARIVAFHERQRPQDWRGTDATGVESGWRWSAIEAVGLYVPGGTASYPSSVLMNAVPAKVAGCRRIVMVAPTPDGALNPLVLAAADLAGVDEIYRIGGAQAVAALAHGTENDPPGLQDCGAGQRLCCRRQAPCVRHRRHRHDRRPLRSSGAG